METLAKRHPRLASGLWFGATALFPAGALGVYYLLLLAAEGPLVVESELPVEGVLAVYLVLLPVVLAFLAGGWIGVHILRLPLADRVEASGWGALVGVASLLAWFGLGELLAVMLDLAPLGDSPASLMVFGYSLAGLGSLVLVVYNAVIGFWLRSAAQGWGLEDTQPGRGAARAG
jgi:hypothetical protein